MIDLSYNAVWCVYGPDGSVLGYLQYDRGDVAAGFEQYENGDGGITFEESMDPGYTVTLVSWGPEVEDEDGTEIESYEQQTFEVAQ